MLPYLEPCRLLELLLLCCHYLALSCCCCTHFKFSVVSVVLTFNASLNARAPSFPILLSALLLCCLVLCNFLALLCCFLLLRTSQVQCCQGCVDFQCLDQCTHSFASHVLCLVFGGVLIVCSMSKVCRILWICFSREMLIVEKNGAFNRSSMLSALTAWMVSWDTVH